MKEINPKKPDEAGTWWKQWALLTVFVSPQLILKCLQRLVSFGGSERLPWMVFCKRWLANQIASFQNLQHNATQPNIYNRHVNPESDGDSDLFAALLMFSLLAIPLPSFLSLPLPPFPFSGATLHEMATGGLEQWLMIGFNPFELFKLPVEWRPQISKPF